MTDWIGQVTLINVGNGDAILVQVPDKGYRDGSFVMLIDGGSNDIAEYADTSTGRCRAVEYLEEKGIRHIDVMVCTHIHEEHTCGLLPVAQRWTPALLWQPFPKEVLSLMRPLKIKTETEAERKFLTALNAFDKLCKLVTKNGGRIVQMTPEKTRHKSLCIAKDVYVKVLGPASQEINRQLRWMKTLYQQEDRRVLFSMDKKMNGASLLLHLTCAGKTFLLAGDTENTGYRQCMEDIQADVFKIGHQGQENSLTMDILQVVAPKYAAVCASGGSGSPDVLSMLAKAQIPVYYSDCPQAAPYTDGVEAHRAVLFQVTQQGILQAAYEPVADREEQADMQECAVDIDIKALEELLEQAGELFLDRAAAEHTRTKGVADYVTEVDYTVQQFIRTRLLERYPQIQLLSEEKSNDEIDKNALTWILDPVDGTTNLIHDYHASVISLALMDKGSVILGMIYNPYSEELFFAQKGRGSYCNGQRIAVSSAQSMEQSVIAVGTSPYYKEMAEQNFAVFKAVFMDCQDIRRSGSAALDLAYVACGRLDGYFERNLKIWDYAAGLLLVREAGGCVQNYTGELAKTDMVCDIVAANETMIHILTERYLHTDDTTKEGL